MHTASPHITTTLLAKMAFKNILRNKRRSFLTISAMTVACSMLMLALGVSAGKMNDMLISATEQYHGHLVVSARGYQRARSIYDHFTQRPLDIARLEAMDEVRGVSPRLRCFGLLSHGKKTSSVEVLGIQPRKEALVTSLEASLTAGSGFGGSGGGALIGEGLARSLGVVPGDSLVFVTRAADGSIGNDLLELKGVFATGNSRNDTALMLVDLPWLQNILVLPWQVHELAISVRHPLEASLVAAKIRPMFSGDLEVQDWSVFLPEIRDAIVISHVTNGIIMVIMYLTAALCVFNTFYMSVLERSREFGIIMALGGRPWNIRVLVLLESLFMGIIAVAFGLLLGFLLNWYLQDVGIDLSGTIAPITYGGGTILPRIHAVIHPVSQCMAALCLVVICPLAGFIPANKAANLTPMEVIRGE